MPYCEECGAEVTSAIKFCEQCGTPNPFFAASGAVQSKGTYPRFCEECGADLIPNARFCEQCGHPVTVCSDTVAASDSGKPSAQKLNPFCFSSSETNQKDIRSAWANFANAYSGKGELGLIIYNKSQLAEDLNSSGGAIQEKLLEVVTRIAQRNVYYAILSVDDNNYYNVPEGDVGGVVKLLSDVVNVARPKYLMILGNEKSIDVATWDNQSYDGDDTVDSDLPYCTLDTYSPWEGQNFNFKDAMRVGRIPSFSGESFNQFFSYFDNAEKGIGNISSIQSFGLSALVWEDESNDEYSAISNKDVYTAPNVTLDCVESYLPSNANLLFFNLHGSDSSEYWYGQEGGSYPEAFAPECLEKMATPYFLGVEACYGARYLDGLDDTESLVLSAMKNKCIAFLGSSKIAYGTCAPVGCCADVIIGEWIKGIKNGETAGDAYINALKVLTSGEMDDADVKTLAEFALYGDPSACTGKNKNIGAMKGLMKGVIGAPKGLKVNLPDVRKAVHKQLVEVKSEINASIDDYVSKNFIPEIGSKAFNMEEIFQKTEKLTNSGLNVKSYIKSSDRFTQVVKVYFDDKGKIHRAVESK